LTRREHSGRGWSRKKYLESFRKYDHNKNDNFCAFFFDRYNFLLKKYIEKERKTKERTEDADDDTLNDISGDEAASLSSEIELSDTLSLLLSMASRFYQHYHGKECNETRRYYTELFTTDKSVCIIKDVCENLRHINENEFFGTINEKYLDFLMSEKCTTAADIVRVRFKTLGELTDNCDPRKKDDEPSQPFGNGIYKKFIFEDKGIKVTDSAISQQKKAFDERIKTILSIK
jgi:hypothetical protein